MRRTLKGQMTNPIRKTVANYLQSCQMADGGFIFTRIEPSGIKETYLATATLAMLRANFNRYGVLRFWEEQFKYNESLDIPEMFWIMASLRILRKQVSPFWKEQWQKYAELLMRTTDEAGLPAAESVSKDLEELFYLTSLHRMFKMEFDKQSIVYRVSDLQQEDGGFGEQEMSDTTSTLYALKILSILRRPYPKKSNIHSYLQEQFLKFNHLESLFEVVEGLSLLGYALPRRKRVSEFIFSCQRDNGGFASAATGMPTIETTYQAVAVMRSYKTI